MAELKNGFLVVLEGLDGSGKSSISRKLVEYLSSSGVECVLTREPTDRFRRSPEMENRRDWLASLRMFFEFTIDRAQHVEDIRKWLSEGMVVICDRFLYSSYAYQGPGIADKFGSLSIAIEWMRSVSHLIQISPDLVIYLDVEPEIAMNRISRRTDIPSGFEELEFLRRVREAYGIIRETKENVVDANSPMEETLNRVIDLLKTKIRQL